VNRPIAFSLTLLLVLSACTPGVTPTSANPTPTVRSTQPADTLPAATHTDPATSTPQTPKASPTPSAVIQSPTSTLMASPSATSPGTPTPPQSARQSQAIIVDHTSVELFEQIPQEYLAKARELKMMFADASVGKNIDDALNCLTAPSWAASPAACRKDYTDPDWNWKTFNQADFAAGKVPPRILFTPDPDQYNRDNWVFERLNGDWSDMTRDFIETLAPAYLDTADVITYQFNYLHVAEFGNIANPDSGFFVDTPGRYDYKDLESFIAEHPDKIFFYWTTSLARSIGSQMAVDFNQQMRQYALDNDLILFDVADIESHTDLGVPCYDSRDGVEYCSRRGDGSTIKCENEPDDGLQLPAICQDYTTEAEGGHLGSVSGGGIRLAKAFWVLMARIAGWQP
jgi:hypothetical protein